MRSFITYFSNIKLPGRVNKVAGFKIIPVILLLFGNFFLYSQNPRMEHRIVDLRYEATCAFPGNSYLSPPVGPFNSPAIVFDLEVRAGENYKSKGWAMNASDIEVHYMIEPGVTVGEMALWKCSLPSPNPHTIITALVTWYPFGAYYPDVARVHIGRYYSLGNPLANDFTEAWSKICTIAIPVTAGIPTNETCFELMVSNGLPTHSTWNSGLAPNPDFYQSYDPACPVKSCLNMPANATFDYDYEMAFCYGAPNFVLSNTSLEGITGTWSPSNIITTNKAGSVEYIFTPNDPNWCRAVVVATVHPPVKEPDIDVDCNKGLITGIKINQHQVNCVYSMDGNVYQTGLVFNPFSLGIASSYTIYVKDTISGCVAEKFIECKACNNCNILNCKLLTDKTVKEDAPYACKYTHSGTGWDAKTASLITVPFDSVKYYINGILTNTGTTLNGAEFPLGTSQVMVETFFELSSDICSFKVIVERVCPLVSDPDGDGNTYSVTQVAGLCWTSNLKTTTYTNGNEIAFAKPYYSSLYNDMEANTNNFGLLYTWYSALGLPEGSNTQIPSNYQGICPDGWHIPTRAEFSLLNIWLAKDLKSIDYWVKPGTNLSGFDSRGAGKYLVAIGKCVDLYGFTGYWASDAEPGLFAPYGSLLYYLDTCDILMDEIDKNDGISVRCVWDGEGCE